MPRVGVVRLSSKAPLGQRQFVLSLLGLYLSQDQIAYLKGPGINPLRVVTPEGMLVPC
jgi:hypothetical protein